MNNKATETTATETTATETTAPAYSFIESADGLHNYLIGLGATEEKTKNFVRLASAVFAAFYLTVEHLGGSTRWNKNAGQILVYKFERYITFHRGVELCSAVESAWKKRGDFNQKKINAEKALYSCFARFAFEIFQKNA